MPKNRQGLCDSEVDSTLVSYPTHPIAQPPDKAHAPSGVSLVAKRRGVDRKHIFICVLARRSALNKLPDQVIEGSSDVEKEVSYEGTETIRRFGESHTQQSDIFVRVLLWNNLAVAVGALSQDLPDGFQMLICPDQFAFE